MTMISLSITVISMLWSLLVVGPILLSSSDLSFVESFIVGVTVTNHHGLLKQISTSTSTTATHTISQPYMSQRLVQSASVSLHVQQSASSGGGSNGDGSDRMSRPMNEMASNKVLYQKIVKPSHVLPDILFLGYLVEYLEKHYQLPENLPMIYEFLPGNEESRTILAWDSPLSPSSLETRMEVEVVGVYTDSHKHRKSIRNKESPLTQASLSSVPNMAMVVVRKAKTNHNTNLPPMMKNLFDDSEKKILKSLDRGLDDFMAGKIKFEEEQPPTPKPRNVKTVHEAIEVELMNSIPDHKSKQMTKTKTSRAEDVVFDTFATSYKDKKTTAQTNNGKRNDRNNASVDEKVKIDVDDSNSERNGPKQPKTLKEAREAAMATMNAQASSSSIPPRTASVKRKSRNNVNNTGNTDAKEDFAVAAAREKAAEKKKKKDTQLAKSEIVEDFAVAAARKVAASKKVKENKRNEKEPKTEPTLSSSSGSQKSIDISQNSQYHDSSTTNPPPETLDPRFKVDDYMGDARAFRVTISKPLERQKSKSTKPKRMEPSPREMDKTENAVDPGMTIQNENSRDDVSSSYSSTTNLKESIEKERNINVNIVDKEDKYFSDDPFTAEKPSTFESLSTPKGASFSSSKGNKIPTPSMEQIEMDIMKAAQNVMTEMAEQGQDLTPEELLRDVLKFEEEQNKENAPGSGFVSGAFEKAKELMRERHQQRNLRQNEKRVKESTTLTGIKPDIIYPSDNHEQPREMSPEEELRQMFEAGEKIADVRITQSSKRDLSVADETATADEDIDALIAEERSISSYARVLDGELVELEVAINKSPGEEFDGRRQNPIFDIMSGPEVYNPNVDLDAVNYPGALPGTKKVNLPKELSEAIKQADFAVDVLTKMKTVEGGDYEHGHKQARYFVGDKELSQEQVLNLQAVVAEATRIGIIIDPLKVMEEQSRLQMILDELWDQPRERFREITDNYKDLLLSDNFVNLVKERLTRMADRDLDALRRDDDSLKEPHAREREILGQLVVLAQALLKEVRALGAELEAQQLEIVRSICKVAMDPSHRTEEETAMALSDAVRDMRPLLDDVFVAYLKYAVAEEEARLARAGLLDDPEENQWLFVLKIVQQGVYAEIAKGINRYIEHIWYVLRMETPKQRRQLLARLIDKMPTMDVRPFVQVVDNIVGSLGDGARGEFDGVTTLGEMTNKLLQLHRDVQQLLPPERIAEKSRDADEWAARQRKRLLEARKIGEQRLQAAKIVADRQEEIDNLGRRGEIERLD